MAKKTGTVIEYYETVHGWRWVVTARNGKVVDRADEPYDSRANARRAFRRKCALLPKAVEKK